MTKPRRSGSRTRAASRGSEAKRAGWFGTWALLPVGILIGAVASGGLALSAWSYWSRSEGSGYRLLTVEAQGDGSGIAQQLAAAGLVDSAWWMSLYLATLGHFGDIVPGQHWLPSGKSPRVLAQCLARHQPRLEVEVTIPEGFDHVRIAQRLEQAGVCSAAAFVAAVRRRDLLDRLAIKGRDGEGYLFPATYRLHLDSDPVAVFERLVTETRNRLRRLSSRIGNEPFEQLASRRGWGESEILTLASIVEKEAQLDDERPIIASVFFNRLDDDSFRPRRMLQSDPTAGYGCLVLGDAIPSCRDFQTRILPAMLRDSGNPYNSYRHAGLPPGPISNPGEASIVAVLRPAATDFLFFVATGDGHHRFSRSFEEHEAKIRNSAP